jgi:hypothetical protein
MYVIVLLVLALAVIVFSVMRDKRLDDAFLATAREMGLTPPTAESPLPDGFSHVYAQASEHVPDPGDLHLPRSQPIVHGVIDGWTTVIWGVEYNSKEPDHAGYGVRLGTSFAALCKPSRRLPKFSFDTKQQIVENVSQDTFRKSAIQSLQELRRRGWSVQSDGQWLLFECGLGSNTGLSSLQLFAELANSIKTERK